MILFHGKILPDKELDRIMEGLQDFCIRAVEEQKLSAAKVIEACDVLSDRIRDGVYDEILQPLLEKGVFTEHQLEEAVTFFCRENLEYKYRTELGSLYRYPDVQNSSGRTLGKMECQTENPGDLQPPGYSGTVRRRLMPLGVLFHIAAGNAEGLPFYSVIEGLLMGNVNILKLPSADDGLSALLLQELMKINPDLVPYLTVFDIPSTNLEMLQKVGEMADAIVVWGGDEAIRAARSLAGAGTQIISWGHKLSFAYAVSDAPEEELRRLASHICVTNQLLCSSCQGIFADTEDMEAVELLGRRFLAVLEEEGRRYPQLHLGIRGKVGISLYNEELEAPVSRRKILRGKGVSVILAQDHTLELSYMFRNCWVKPLPRKEIVKALKPYRGYLQTVGLICPRTDRAYLEEQLFKAGVVRITDAGGMSDMVAGGGHDGEYPLRRYSRIVEVYKQ
ncbi:acyl-CoA reductase [Lachnospiraceae bacterium 46-15]